jgi:hypothetical protein
MHTGLMCYQPVPAVGVEAEDDKIEMLIKEMDGKDVNEVISEGEHVSDAHCARLTLLLLGPTFQLFGPLLLNSSRAAC